MNLMNNLRGYSIGDIKSIISKLKNKSNNNNYYIEILNELYLLYPPPHMKSYISECIFIYYI